MRTFFNNTAKLLALSGIIIFTSCGDKEVNKPTPKSQSVKEKPAATFTMKNGEDVQVRTRELTQADKDRVAKNSMKRPGTNENSPGTLSTKPSNNQDPSNYAKSDRAKLASVPDACALITKEEIAKIFGISAGAISEKDASHTKSPYTRSCFYRWEGASPNTGILLQVQANPVAEEYAEWVSLYVESKRTTGEKEMGSNDTYRYKKLEGLGDDGSYSHRLGKYVWRDANNYVFMVAFNTNSAPEVQMKNVKSIGKIMMSNYSKIGK